MIKYNKKLIIHCLFLLFISFSCQKNNLYWQKTLNYNTNELFPIRIGDYGYPYIDVFINGKKVNLAWDTGNMRELVLDAKVINNLALPVSGTSKSYDSSGKLIETRNTYEIAQFIAFGDTFYNQTTHEFDHPKLNGLLGPYFIFGKRFTLDYKNKVLAVSDTPLPINVSKEKIFKLIQSPAKNLKPMLLIKGIVNGKEVVIQVDTGKSRTTVDEEFVRIMKLPKVKRGYKIDSIRLGPYSFSVPSAKEVNFKGISRGLAEPIMIGIGSDILSKLVMSVDYSQHIMLIH